MFAGKKSAQIREILISESAWEEMTCLFAPSLTSLPEDEYSAEQVADCYRLRWQIELAFKRLKSLLHLDALRAKEPELAKAWIFANLLAAFLIDDIIQPSLDFPPRSAGSEKKN